MAPKNAKPYVLGLDLGVQSAGWMVIDLDDRDRPCGVRRAGVRCFESGVGNETEIASGKDESQNIKRRQARLQRRQLWRRGRRLKKVFNLLQKAGLLPPDEARTPQQRHEILYKLDAELSETYVPDDDRVAAHLLPYRLRCLALDQALPPFAFGRALFHLAQRRGFASNRKSDAKDDKETSEVKASIGELYQKIEEAKARTLGEYFAGLDPEEQRIRKRWTARKMYSDEFDTIWMAQAPHHPSMTDEWKERIQERDFPPAPSEIAEAPDRHVRIGTAVPPRPRASLEAQRFRYLQKVNDLEISTPDGEVWKLVDPEHTDLRTRLVDFLETHAELEFRQMRSKLGLKKPKGSETDYAFNLEAGGEKKLKGNATATKLRKVLGDDYEKFSPEQLAGIVEDLLDYEKKDALAQRLNCRYGIAPGKANELADVTLEPYYASLSREAMRKLLPLLESGRRIATLTQAERRSLFPNMKKADVCDFLPPVLDAVELRNPVVCRGLTELRKVVNALIREYGKPQRIRVELARDLKRSRKQRKDLTDQMRQNEKARVAAKRKILEEIGNDNPKPGDVLKVLLAEECNWECPYTGKRSACKRCWGHARNSKSSTLSHSAARSTTRFSTRRFVTPRKTLSKAIARPTKATPATRSDGRRSSGG